MVSAVLEPHQGKAGALDAQDCAMHRQRGTTLVESLMVIGIIAILIVGGVLLYQQAVSGSKSTSAQRQLLAVQAAVRNLYSTQSSYAGLSNTVLFDANVLPGDMRDEANGADFTRHALGGLVTVQEDPTDAQKFQITFGNVASSACIDLVRLNVGSGSSSGVDSVDVDGNVLTLPVDVPQAVTACGDGSARVAVTWTMF